MLTSTRYRVATPPRKVVSFILASSFFGIIFFLCLSLIPSPRQPKHSFQNQTIIADSNREADASHLPTSIETIAKNFTLHPLNGPNFKYVFGELGQRVQALTPWILEAQSQPTSNTADNPLLALAENLTVTQFPFLRNPKQPDDQTPVTTLRSTYVIGSQGIVIPVRPNNFRFSVHLILNLNSVLKSRLPIQIVYAGDDGLPSHRRRRLLEIDRDIEFLDILTIFDNNIMGLEGEWAIKPFAALASTFESVILIDADAVFLQKPEVLFEHTGFKETGAKFFHDRLLFQHSYQGRHKWWKEQLGKQVPSEMLMKSLVWNEDYAEEADSGVVVLDKSRLPTFMGLLHVCWQNTKAVRESVTYKITYGDKESWWFGLELCGAPYAFEWQYGGAIGKFRYKDNRGEICGFAVAHSDDQDRIVWYNGSLLKNKAVDEIEFDWPEQYMLDGSWIKGNSKEDVSCMTGGTIRDSFCDMIHPETIKSPSDADFLLEMRLTPEQQHAIRKSIELAERADEEHSLI
ncbi:related to MNT3-alpha-1,3-mannosyltransferases responsible for adding the terminal mannose resi [Phialocephala subalpina]|uniref:Related to MNT3-alpha-1,3-mannosyltransferases responsible for adding the terminal mannose resi n=1 Tax=Phialocephala subalpina TaxID=576137 RepID=A0A1L7WW88_9HELO|nr:related to MNT3-alpha-1,3-mannosyltransferases responsible for adding the terminal mannose resi [Phialocephala subalpina]